MIKDPSRLRVAVLDPTNFGQTVISDLLIDEGVRDITKFFDARDLVLAFLVDRFDLVIVDDEAPRFSVSELMQLAKGTEARSAVFIALQSALPRFEVQFLRDHGIGGLLLKPVAPKRFAHLFRSLFRAQRAVNMAA